MALTPFVWGFGFFWGGVFGFFFLEFFWGFVLLRIGTRVLCCDERNCCNIDLSYIHMKKSVFKVEDIFNFISCIKFESHDKGNVCLRNY